MQSTLGFLLMMIVQMAYATTLNVRERLQSDIHVCVFEIADHVYSPLSFYLSESAFVVSFQALGMEDS